MRSILIAILVLLVNPAGATINNSGHITGSRQSFIGVEESAPNWVEGGLQFHSINNGVNFVQAAMLHSFADWFALGARALLPLNYSRESNVYLGQLEARFNLTNTEDKIYINSTFSQAFFTDSSGAHPFGMLGIAAGYMRQLNPDFLVGLNLGVDYGSRVFENTAPSGFWTLYNKLSLVGGYYF